MKKVSVIVPCYNESSSLSQLYAALRELMDSQSQYDWEILMVNDGSQDNTLQVIKELRQQDPRVCYIDLSRNFGKERAMLAGFDHVTGDCTAIIDADLQHPPMVIADMLQLWEQGYQDICVLARRRRHKRRSVFIVPWCVSHDSLPHSIKGHIQGSDFDMVK